MARVALRCSINDKENKALLIFDIEAHSNKPAGSPRHTIARHAAGTLDREKRAGTPDIACGRHLSVSDRTDCQGLC